jgi:hypothetical protein
VPEPDQLFRLRSSEKKDLAVLQMMTDTLELSHRAEFLAACARLLETARGRLVIDLRGLRRIFSIFVGTVMDVNAKVRGEGRRLTVIATPEVEKLFRTVVGPESLEICNPASPIAKASRRKSTRFIR